MKRITNFSLLMFLILWQTSLIAQSGFVNLSGNTATNSSFSVGQTFAHNEVSAVGYTNEGVQHAFLYHGVDTLLAFDEEIPYPYRQASRYPLGEDYSFDSAGAYDTYLLPLVGIDSLIDVMFYSVTRPDDVDTIAPYSVCAIPISLPQPAVHPDNSVPPVQVVNDESLAEYACDSTYFVTWNFSVADKSITDIQEIKVHFPSCGLAEVTDVDGNVYDAVRINCLCWTKQNLKSLHYADYTPIPVALAYQSDIYPNAAENANVFGNLYSWYSAVRVPEDDASTMPTVDESGYVQGVCPDGWRVPTKTELETLSEIPTFNLTTSDYWMVPGGNSTDFSALPAGMYYNGRYWNLMGNAYFWSCTGNGPSANLAQIAYSCSDMLYISLPKDNGLSVRCVKN